jgi:hypothetical protein
MTKSPLAACLIVMQLLSTGAAPLFLCLDSDGSVGIDFGPSGCDCCHDDHQHLPAESSLALHAGLVAASQHAPCECAHIQISPSAGPVISSPTLNIQPEFFQGIFGSPAAAPAISPAAPEPWQLAGDPAQFWALAPSRSSIALRC